MITCTDRGTSPAAPGGMRLLQQDKFQPARVAQVRQGAAIRVGGPET